MNDLLTIKGAVKRILETDVYSRSSDLRLYLMLGREANESAMDMSFSYVISNLSYLGLPNFESVRRTRQKVQAENPELRPDTVVADARRKLEDEYHDFAVEGWK